MIQLFANSGDPDQTPRSAMSDLDLHLLLVTRIGIYNPQCVNSQTVPGNDRSCQTLPGVC